MTDVSVIRHWVSVPPGDPVNDQLASYARDDLARHVESARATLDQGDGDRTGAMACIATVLTEQTDVLPRSRLANMLAAALIQLAETPS